MTIGNNFQLQESRNRIIAVKRSLLYRLMRLGASTIADLAKDLDLSVPTVTKFLSELIQEKYILDLGKLNSSGGRKPNLFGLNPNAGYFVGIDVQYKKIQMAVMDFEGKTLNEEQSVPYSLKNTPEAFDRLCAIIRDYIENLPISQKKISRVGINLAGRVNPITGYSYSYFQFGKQPLAQVLEKQIGFPVHLDNDSRAMTYGEYMVGNVNEKDVLFININWGLGAGLIIDGKLYYGKSGLSGEIGHICALNNEIICNCGKKGCLETEVSGFAVKRLLNERMTQGCSSIMADMIKEHGELLLSDFVEAVHKGDVLSIEIVEHLGVILGRWLAGLINLLNPELIIVGGPLAETKDYLRYPIQSAIYKYTLNLANKDTKLQISQLGERAALFGACLLSRSKMLDII